MAVCTICNESVFIGKSIRDGIICKNCYRKIPISMNVNKMDSDTVREVIYKNNNLIFEQTAIYGKLSIDEMHGTFKIKKDEVVYSMLDITDIGIYCIKPSVNKNNSVYCDVEFNCEFENGSTIKKVIKQHVNCRSKKKNANELIWEEPGDLSMFKNMFIQGYNDAVMKYNRKVQNHFVSKREIDILKATALFMLDETSSEKEIEKVKNTLLEAFKSDEKRCNIINKSYAILKN